MSDNTLNKFTDPHPIIADDFNQYAVALSGDFVGRSATTNAPSSAERLGTPVVPWAELHVTNAFIGGALLDLDNLGAGTNTKNTVSDGATRSGSGMPDFIRASGTTNEATVLADAVDFKYTANNVGVILTSDVTLTSLVVAPSTENTATVNDTTLTGNGSSRYAGEGAGATIALDNVGTEITDRVGQYICLKHGTSEYMLAYVLTGDAGASTATLSNVFRGFFFDDAGAPIVREAMSDNDTLTLASLGWVFAQNNGTIFDVSYRSPIYSATEPATATTDDYWYNTTLQNWYRYDGTEFLLIERTLIGMVVCDGTNCVASRSSDFTKSFSDLIDIEIDGTPASDTVVQSAETFSKISVYGKIFEQFAGREKWDIEADLESGLTEAADTLYYLYITETGETIISEERPYDRTADLRGYYHPYHSWRYVGVAFNDSGSDFSSANSKNNNQQKVEQFTSSDEFLPLPNIDNVKVTITGGGGGGAGGSGYTYQNGGSGGTTSFGSIFSATGGGGGSINTNQTGTGGSGGRGVGGDEDLDGQDGGSGGGFGTSSENYGKFSIGGLGGSSHTGGGGRNGARSGSNVASASSGGNYGGGGGGAATALGAASSQWVGGGGGGGGGTAVKFINNVAARVPITIGGGGSNGTAAGSGAAGICIVEY